MDSLKDASTEAATLKPGLNWTPEELQYLIDNRMTMSMTELARKLGKTKGAIAGKTHRLKLKMDPLISRKLTSRGVKRSWDGPYRAKRAKIVSNHTNAPWNPIRTTYKLGTKATPKHMIEPPVGILSGVGVKLWLLESHHCKWVVGEPSDLNCCGNPRHTGSVYCEQHHNIAYKGKFNGKL